MSPGLLGRYVIGSCIKHIPLAGRDITNFIQLLMRERESGMPTCPRRVHDTSKTRPCRRERESGMPADEAMEIARRVKEPMLAPARPWPGHSPRHVRDMSHRSNTATSARTWPRSARSMTRLCWVRVAAQTHRGRVRRRSSRSMTRTRGGGCARPPATRRRASHGRQHSLRLLSRSVRPPWQHSSRLLSRSVYQEAYDHPAAQGARGERRAWPTRAAPGLV